MTEIHHHEDSRDSLYYECSENLDAIFSYWQSGKTNLRFSIPILCAVRLEAFINVAGKLHVPEWDKCERGYSFEKKCKTIFQIVKLSFDSKAEPNRTALEAFEIRNELVHPKMTVVSIRENISQDEYERRQKEFYFVEHPLRSALTPERVIKLKEAGDAFVQEWSRPLLRGNPEEWLRWRSTGGFTLVSKDAG